MANKRLKFKALTTKDKIIVIGASAGGVKALQEFLSLLPESFSHPIVIILHRSEITYDYLVNTLQKATQLNVCEAMDKQPLTKGVIAIAPAGYHLLIDNNCLALSIDNEVNNARPSIDVLMESAADEYGAFVVGITLSAGGIDGIRGMNKIKHYEGRIFVQSPETCEDPSLSNSMLELSVVDKTSSIQDIVNQLI